MRTATDFLPSSTNGHRSSTEPATLQPLHTYETPRSCLPSSCSSPEGAEYSALAARATNDAVRDWDVKTGHLSWPQGLENLLGYNPETVAPEISFWHGSLHPEDQARVTMSLRQALADADTTQWTGEYRFRYADGPFVHLLERATIVRDAEGQAVRFVGSLMDITARKQLQDQLCRSQKMEAFGQLAGGVAHDFNNFLTTILGYSDLLLCELAVKGHLAEHIGEIRKAAGRASALASQLLAFSRKHPLEAKVVEVNALIVNMERSLFRLLGENIGIECDLHRGKDGLHVKVDPGQFTQIILNLAVNARDAMQQGGRLKLATTTVRVNEETQPGGCEDHLPAGDYVAVSVTDNGSGMSDEVKAHLFEPFFTTKHGGHGSGLGLATSYGIVRQSGGDICIESELGSGTTVTIYLPQLTAPVAATHKRPNRKLPTGTETLLVLEDDVAVRHISVRVLRSLGYDVLEAANADDAQRLVESRGEGEIHLLLTDVVLPQMSGRLFAEWMRATSPTTKVMFISGYLEESLQSAAAAGEETFFLPKPFDPEQLAGKVREALDSGARKTR